MQNKNLTEEVLKDIISRITQRPKDRISHSSLLRGDLGLDSMGSLELLVTLEECYHYVVPQEAVHQFETFGDLATHLKLGNSLELAHSN